MVKVLPVFILLLVGSLTQAQVLELSPNPVHAAGAVDEDLKAVVTITNTSGETINLLWSRNVVEAPETWTSWLCDLNACYTPGISTCPESRPNVLADGESMDLEVHVMSANVNGFAQIEIELYDASDHNNVLATVETTFETSTSSTHFADQEKKIRIYPNPAADYFRIFQDHDVERVQIYDVAGNLVRDYRYRTDGQYDVSILTEGIYLVRLFSSDRKVLKTVRLSKR